MFSNLFPFLTGAITLIMGVCLQRFLDYKFLKNPNIKINASVIGKGRGPVRSNNFAIYNYEIVIEISNYSKNEAYGFEIIKFTTNAKFILQATKKVNSSMPVTDQSPLTLRIPCTIELAVPNYQLTDSQTMLSDQDLSYKLSIKYYNPLGKVYSNTIHGLLINGSDGFELWTGQVI